MALTVQLRKKILTRVILKMTNGELDPDVVLNRLVAAIGTNLDDLMEQEKAKWAADLQSAKASAQAQIASIDAEVLGLQ